jgi:3-isopropylmalate dehydrogenase
MEEALLGGCAVDAARDPYPEATQKLAKRGRCGAARRRRRSAVGHAIPASSVRSAACCGIRKDLGLFANLRPAVLYPELANASTLKPEVVAGLDILIVRELTGDIYFGQPRGIEVREVDGLKQRSASTPCIYSESEIRRIARVAFEAARKRNRKVCSVDKMNVLECTQLWRDVATDDGEELSGCRTVHMLVDNAAMQLVKNPKQFDVMVTGNMFGDILSDEASMLTGSIGMLPSASLDANNKGLYEPSHGSAPDIAGKGVANPLATILSAAMMLRYTFGHEAAAQAHRGGREESPGAGPAHRRYLRGRDDAGGNQGNGRRGDRGAVNQPKEKAIMKRVGLVGWRGMVGSVLMQRMREENDFAHIEPVFFTTSNVGGKAPDRRRRARAQGRERHRRAEVDGHHHQLPGWRLHHRGLSQAARGRLERSLDRCRVDAAHEGRCGHHPRSRSTWT